MSEFKVNDEVRIVKCNMHGRDLPCSHIEDIKPPYRITDIHETGFYIINCQYDTLWDDDELELVTTKEEKPVARRTFRQIKESDTVKKGAVWQEMCDDGTQPYELVDGTYHKDGSTTPRIDNRSLVEEQPTWFVEVFEVEPQYMTAEELKQWEAFKKGQKPAHKKRGRPAKTTKRVRLSKNGKRLGRPPKAQ